MEGNETMYTHLKTINSCVIKLVLGIGDWCCYCEVITQKKKSLWYL